jgi:hypothetical protein
MEAIGEIQVLIEELNRTAGNNDLVRKLEIGDKLATYNWHLAAMEADVHADANMLEYEYKASVAREINRTQGSATLREALAKEKYTDLCKNLVQKQNLLKRLSLLRQQTTVVIEQNRQTVSALKQEWKQNHQ